MLYFSVMLILIAASGLVLLSNNKKKNLIFVILFFLISTFFLGLRKETVGTDTPTYVAIFDDIAKNGFDSRFFTDRNMQVYSFINLVISKISTNHNFFIFCMSAFTMLLASIFLYKNCEKHIFMSTLLYFILYFYFKSFNISRQFISVLIVANAYALISNEISKKRFACFALLLVVSFFIHNTSIISIIALPAFLIKNNRYKIVYSLFASIIFVILIANVSYLANLSIFEDYSEYLYSSSRFNIFDSSSGNMIYVYLTYVAIILFVLFIILKNSNYYDINVTYFSVFIIYTLISICSFRVILFSRLSYYFALSSLIIIPETFINMRKQDRWLPNLLILLVYLIPFYIMLNSGIDGVIPYSFFWN